MRPSPECQVSLILCLFACLLCWNAVGRGWSWPLCTICPSAAAGVNEMEEPESAFFNKTLLRIATVNCEGFRKERKRLALGSVSAKLQAGI